MKINKMISRYNQSSRYGNKVKYIVIHYVGAISSARNNCLYFKGGDRQASAHYFVDSAIWQCVPERKAAWHCGGGLQDTGSAMVGGNRGATLHGICTNSNSIGIELCCCRKDGKIVPTEEAIKTAAPLVKHLMKKYSVPASRVVRHFDVTGKCCPNGYISKSAWAGLRSRLTGMPDPSSLPYPSEDTKRGDHGSQVRKLQRCLDRLMDADLTVDGSYGPATEAAVRKFQKKCGLTPDGMAGSKTRSFIRKLMK